MHSGMTFRRPTRKSASVGARSATCSTARSSVMLIGSPANIASRSAATSAASASLRRSCIVLATMRFLE